MAVIHTEKKRFNLALPVLAAAAIAAGMGIWWYQQANTPTSVTPIAPAISAPTPPSPVAVATNTAPAALPDTAPPPQVVEKLIEDQKQAAREVDAQPQLKPIKGPVTTRPAFLSEMEWSVFKTVSMQQADPDKALTALVNKVRFIKQLELLQDIPAAADNNKRRLLANELLDDLPQRLANEDYDLAGALKLQTELLQDAEPEAKARAKRATKEARRLEQAHAPKDAAS